MTNPDSDPDQPPSGLSNAVLTTNNLILQANAAFNGSNISFANLLDLAALVEAVVLQDQLLFLRSPGQFDFSALPLGKVLLDEGILQSFEPPVSVHEIQEGIYHLFGIPDAYDKVTTAPFAARLDEASVLPYYGDYDYFSPNRVHTLLAEVELARRLPPSDWLETQKGLERSLPYYCYSLVDLWAGNNAWARRAAQAFLVRTLVYWSIADRLKLSFYPDLSRIPIVTHVTRHLEHFLAEGIYPRIAQAFYVSLDEIKRACLPFSLPIPPLLTLLLESAASPQDIPAALLELRQRFSGLRDHLRRYEWEIRHASTLDDLNQARADLLAAAHQWIDDAPYPDYRRILETTSYLQQASRLGYNPRDAQELNDELRFVPLAWIRSWYLNRNTIHLCDLQKKHAYRETISRVAGRLFDRPIELDQPDLYPQYLAWMEQLYFSTS